jgi:hypothetical protein
MTERQVIKNGALCAVFDSGLDGAPTLKPIENVWRSSPAMILHPQNSLLKPEGSYNQTNMAA